MRDIQSTHCCENREIFVATQAKAIQHSSEGAVAARLVRRKPLSIRAIEAAQCFDAGAPSMALVLARVVVMRGGISTFDTRHLDHDLAHGALRDVVIKHCDG